MHPTASEELVHEIWCEVLGRNGFGVDDAVAAVQERTGGRRVELVVEAAADAFKGLERAAAQG